jgi:sugar phosphate isomerase/epimerase
VNRRDAISAFGGAALAGRQAFAQQSPAQKKPAEATPPARVTPEVEAARLKARTRPSLCVYSGCLSKIPYTQLSEIVGQMGYDGVDLTVMQGGHVDPSRYMVDLDRAFQTFQDAGIELPMVTTDFTSPSAPYAYAILYVSGELGARFCRLGTWPPLAVAEPTGQNPAVSQYLQMRAMMMRNDLTQFSVTGLRCNITPLLANHAGSFPGRSIPETEAMLAGVAPKAFGYCFDPVQAVIEGRSANAWEAALQAALPRLAAVALSDVALENENGNTKPRPCPLGEGAIDWKKFFSALAAARFHGPVSIHMDYETRNEVNSMRKDLAFARARVEEAWPIS